MSEVYDGQGPAKGRVAQTLGELTSIVQHPAFRLGFLDAQSGRPLDHDLIVDRIMRDHGIEFIDVLKMDIEGAEKEVFENATPWIDKVGILIVELHERLKPGCSRSFYNATNDFDLEWTRGENIFLTRSGKRRAGPSA